MLSGLRELRESRGEKQTELAKALGVTSGLISQYELGITQPSIEMAVKLADHYGVSVDRLFYGGRTGSRK